MTSDPIVEEVRQAGDAYFRHFNYNLKAALDDLRRRSEEAKRNLVSLPPRRKTPTPSKKVG
jgi:hypothetical protein